MQLTRKKTRGQLHLDFQLSSDQANSLSSQLSKFEDKKRKHVQTLERKTSNMKQMFKKGKGKRHIEMNT